MIKKEGFFYSIGIGDYHNPLWEALFDNQYEGMTEGFKHYSHTTKMFIFTRHGGYNFSKSNTLGPGNR